MPSSTYLTSQGEAWDQVALDQYEDEHLMHELLAANVDEMDTIFFAGEVEVAAPEVDTDDGYVAATPPWERTS